MSAPLQLSFPFPSLDFEGQPVLTVDNIAKKFRWTTTHILNLVEQGELVAIDGKSKGVTRRNCRVAVEAYRTFVLKRMTGPFRQEFLNDLPRHVRVQLIAELQASLS